MEAEDICKVGDTIDVKLLLIDDQGRLKLSRKAAIAETRKQQQPKEKTENTENKDIKA